MDTPESRWFASIEPGDNNETPQWLCGPCIVVNDTNLTNRSAGLPAPGSHKRQRTTPDPTTPSPKTPKRTRGTAFSSTTSPASLTDRSFGSADPGNIGTLSASGSDFDISEFFGSLCTSTESSHDHASAACQGSNFIYGQPASFFPLFGQSNVSQSSWEIVPPVDVSAGDSTPSDTSEGFHIPRRPSEPDGRSIDQNIDLDLAGVGDSLRGGPAGHRQLSPTEAVARYLSPYHRPWNSQAAERPLLPPGQAMLVDFPPTPNDFYYPNAFPVPRDTSLEHELDFTTALAQTTAIACHRGNSNQIGNQWQNFTVGAIGPQVVDGSGRGRRSKPLSKERNEKANAIRQIGACAYCWIHKVSCSKGIVCVACQKAQHKSPLQPSICFRGPLIDHEGLFRPGWLVSHLSEGAIVNMVNYHIGWTGNKISVEVTSSRGCPPMKFDAYEFVPTEELQRHVQLRMENGRQQFVQRMATPVGMMSTDMEELKTLCRPHVKELALRSEYASQAALYQGNTLPSKVIGVVSRYYKRGSLKDQLVGEALRLHAMQYFMSVIITFTKASAEAISGQLHAPLTMIPPREYRHPSSRLINRQLKTAMSQLMEETTRNVLEEFEKKIRDRHSSGDRYNSDWPSCFCAFLVLSLCIENFQIAADGFVCNDLATALELGQPADVPRAESLRVVREMDERLFTQSMELFNGVFKSRRKRGFNPVRDIDVVTKNEKWSVAAKQMVGEVRDLLREHHDDMKTRSQEPFFAEMGDLGKAKDNSSNVDMRSAAARRLRADHLEFASKNPGRLVSKFLSSLLRARYLA